MHTLRRLAPALVTLIAGIVLGAAAVGGHATAAAGLVHPSDAPPLPRGQTLAPAANPLFSTDVVAQTIDVATSGRSLRWDKSEYAAAAGDVTFVVQNRSPLRRTFIVEGNDIREPSLSVEGGETKIYTLKGLAAGQYQIVDNITGYAKAGAVAALIVR